jgi:Voltage-dependent anion channel
MNWYSFVFPNTALTTATFAISVALGNNRSFAIIGCVLTVTLVIMWIFVFSMMIRAVYLRHILWPQMQEDRDEGGWGRSGRKKTLRASLLPSDQPVPAEVTRHPVSIGTMESSGAPVLVAVDEKEKRPAAV